MAQTRRPAAAITLVSPEAEVPALPVGRRLVLRFHDIAGPADGLIPPDAALVGRLLDFARAWSPEEGPLLIHCHAGVSRSTAAAYAVACDRAGPGREAALAAGLRGLSPSATPNRLLVALADDILGRRGDMSAAVAAIGRGAECFEGETFALDV